MRALAYHDDRDQLRRDLLQMRDEYFTAKGPAGVGADPAFRLASLIGDSIAYNLAGAIRWVAQNVGEQQADDLADWISYSLTNGDDVHELNSDLLGLHGDGAKS